MRSLLFPILALAGGSGPSEYLEAAQAAPEKSRERTACLAAWASLAAAGAESGFPDSPTGLGSRGARLLGRTSGGRLYVRKVDPLGVFGSVEAWLLRPERAPRRLAAVEPGVFALPPGLPGDQVELRSRAPGCLPERVLLVSRIARAGPLLPSGPGATSPGPAFPGGAPEPSAGDRSIGFDGWWYLAIGIAAVGASIAVYQEVD